MRLYDDVYSLMNSIWNKIRSPKQIVLSTAMVYFHKYFFTIRQIHDDREKLNICIACLFLATKSCNYLISLKELVKYHTMARDNNNVEFFESIYQTEFNILSAIGFDLEVDLPYNYLIHIKAFFDRHLNLNTKKLTELCCYYINDSFTLPLCLFYSPATIAFACVFLLFQQLNFGIAIDTVIAEMNIGHTVHLEDVMHCAEVMARIYTKENSEKSNHGHNADNAHDNATSEDNCDASKEMIICNQDS